MTEVEKVKRRWAKQEETDLASAIDALLQAPNGRRFLWWLLGLGKVGNQPFSTDAAVTAFNCGELNVGNQIMAQITATNPEGYTNMMREMLDERNSRDAELGAATDADRGHAEPDQWSDRTTDD